MCRLFAVFFCSLGLIASTLFNPANQAHAADRDVKEWTFLVFLNGKNNLDQFGHLNMNQMEKIGSTEKINIVVEWGSLKNGKTQRVFVTKDDDMSKVTSPVLEDKGTGYDMGSYQNLVEFVKWGAKNFPAKKYFVSLWDHGSGWHDLNRRRSGGFTINDISWDDETNNFMTTEQVGVAMREIAAAIGQKVDVYGNDACLMAMAEVAGETSDSVNVMIGSQDLEPAEGWPYDQLLERWNALPEATAQDVGKILTEEFVKSYQGGQYGWSEVLLSAYDLNHQAHLQSAVADLGAELLKLDVNDKAKVVSAISKSQAFYYYDYVDLGDFVKQLQALNLTSVRGEALTAVTDALSHYVVASHTTPDFAKATGVAMWIPDSKWTFDRYITRYEGLSFHKETKWGDALRHLLQQ